MASPIFSALLVVAVALVGQCRGQDEYIPPQGVPQDIPIPQPQNFPQQHNFQQPQFNHFGGNHEAFLASFQAQQLFQNQQPINNAPIQHDGQNFQPQFPGNGPVLQDQQNLVTKVFVKPDGSVGTIQVPQNFNF